MGTRSETVIWDGQTMIVLYRHWDGYPSFMLPHFREIAEFAKYMAKEQTHWLTYAEDVAAYMIGYDCIKAKEQKQQIQRKWKRDLAINVGFRPVGNIADVVEFVYVVDVSNGSWRIDCYKVEEYKKFWDMPREERDKLYMSLLNGGVTDLLVHVAHEEIQMAPMSHVE